MSPHLFKRTEFQVAVLIAYDIGRKQNPKIPGKASILMLMKSK